MYKRHYYAATANHSLVEMTYMNNVRALVLLSLATALVVQPASAQVPARDPSTRLREVLPADVAQRVLSRIEDARARQLPAQAQRMEAARFFLSTGRGSTAAADEIEAGAEAMRKGVEGSSVSLLAKSAPLGRSLAVPLFVIGSLTDRG